MNAQQIRNAYLKFFEERGHKIIPRASLVPQNDPTTLFTGSGMQPLIPYLMGEPHPAGKRVADSQTCLRAEDIEEVGDNRHTTFFEMLGNWSFGDYFKAEQLPWFWEFLTDVVGLDPKRLYVTVFIGDEKAGIPKDTEAVEIWKRLFKDKGIDAKDVEIGSEEDGSKKGMRGGRIFYYDASKNWWTRAGKINLMPEGELGGPDSEVFYEFDEIEHDPKWGEKCHVNCDCGRYLEIGNSVFMQYKRGKDGFEELPNKNVDFGGGMERIAAAQINSPDVFKISVLWPIIEKIQSLSGKPYEAHTAAMRVVADHLRAAVFLGVDGVVPSNTGQGYVMRRLMRRAMRFGLELGIDQDLMPSLVPVAAELYADDYPEVKGRQAEVQDVMSREEKLFRQTLKSGVREFGKRAKRGPLSGRDIFMLYDTYGFPAELTLEEAFTQNVEVEKNWKESFEKLMTEQRERSRTAGKGVFKGGLADHSEQVVKYHTATHMVYKALRIVLGEHVVQRGSNITPERLRFDFSHPEKMTPEQIAEVEKIVNEKITEDLPVGWQEYPTKEAFEKGAYGAFGDKYGEKVKVYKIGREGEQPYSFEICGGPHVERTGVLGEGNKTFKITKEEASSAGVRRIKAVLL